MSCVEQQDDDTTYARHFDGGGRAVAGMNLVDLLAVLPFYIEAIVTAVQDQSGGDSALVVVRSSCS